MDLFVDYKYPQPYTFRQIWSVVQKGWASMIQNHGKFMIRGSKMIRWAEFHPKLLLNKM